MFGICSSTVMPHVLSWRFNWKGIVLRWISVLNYGQTLLIFTVFVLTFIDFNSTQNEMSTFYLKDRTRILVIILLCALLICVILVSIQLCETRSEQTHKLFWSIWVTAMANNHIGQYSASLEIPIKQAILLFLYVENEYFVPANI